MTNLDRQRRRTSRRATTELITEAITASYIHDISERHRRNAAARRRQALLGAGAPSLGLSRAGSDRRLRDHG
jgi:hypothetical protein